MITNRILEIAKLVPHNSKIIVDVGCDHCYSALAIRKQNINSLIIACDSKLGPLENCEKTCIKHNIENIELKISNGLSEIKDNYDVLIISGLGGEKISEILKNSNHDFTNKTLILQPNNGEEIIRKFIQKNKLLVSKELIIKEKNIFYYIIKIDLKGNEIKNKEEIEFGLFKNEKKCSILIEEFYLWKIKNLKYISNRIPKNNFKKYNKFINQIKKIKIFLNSLNFD